MNFSRADSVRSDVDLIRHLSERAKAERAPGQTLHSKLNELRRNHELVVPFATNEPHMTGGTASQ